MSSCSFFVFFEVTMTALVHNNYLFVFPFTVFSLSLLRFPSMLVPCHSHIILIISPSK